MAEWAVELVEGLVKSNMGEFFAGMAPFVAAILALSAFSSLMSLIGLFSPTSDLNIVAGWAILVFILITYYKMKCGPLHYLKSFAEPVPFLAPLNIISEVATPISMAFRHYGNILSGTVISVLIAAGLQGLSAALLGWLPGFFGRLFPRSWQEFPEPHPVRIPGGVLRKKSCRLRREARRMPWYPGRSGSGK